MKDTNSHIKSKKEQRIITFGCRLNAYESEVIKQNLEKSSIENVTVFNTCAVTKEAERQAKQAIRKHYRQNPDKKIIVTGCAAQISPNSYAEIEGVTQVLGNDEKLKAESYEKNNFIGKTEKLKVNDIMSIKETAGQFISKMSDNSRAFMQIQNGCDHRCTFCIIPYGRGNSRSVPVGEIVYQGQKLVEQNYNEIVFTGVDMTSYGHDLPANPSLGAMTKRFLKFVPISRLRLSSIDVAEIDNDLLDLVENESRLMPHLHLSLQAGDDMILKRMKRRHTRQQTVNFCEKARLLRPDIVFGADIITGFPTETDEMFQNTIDLIKEINLIHLHVFPYSEREGTPAAKIPTSKQIPKNIRKERAAILRAAGQKNLEIFLKSRVGKTENILIEKNNTARTEHFAEVILPENFNANAGEVKKVTIKNYEKSKLYI